MRDAGSATVDRQAGEQRRLLHGPAGIDVVGLGHRGRKVIDHQPQGVERRRGHQGGGAASADGFEGVDERVEAGGGGHVGRHRHRRHRVEHHQIGQQLVAPRPDLAPLAVGHDARACHFGAGAGGGGDGDDRAVAGQRVGGERVVLDAHRSRCDDRRLLGGVERAAAADADHDRSGHRAHQICGGVDRRRVRFAGGHHVSRDLLRPGERRNEGGRDAVDVAVGDRRFVDDHRRRARAPIGHEIGDRLRTRGAHDHPRHPTAFVRCHARHGAIYGTPVPGTAVDRTAARR